MSLEEMTSGRELDARVAEEVMGCEVRKSVEGWPFCYCQDGPHAGPDSFHCHLKHYSTDVAAALELKDRMVEDGFSFSLFESRTGAIRVSFICPAGPCEKHGNFQCNHHGSYEVEADTVPLAICKAAMVALKHVES